MAGLVRYTQQLFASSGLTPSGGFAAAANGTVTTENGSSNTPNNIMTAISGAFNGGWIQAVLGASKFPAVEDMNAVDYTFSYQLAYLFERGIPEYDSGTTYNTGDITRQAATGNIYLSKIDTNLGNALSNGTDWQYCGNIKQIINSPYPSGTSGGSANAQTLTTGFGLAALTAGQIFTFTAGFTNTATVTLAIDSVSAANLYVNGTSGVVTAPANTVISGNDYMALYDGTHLVIIGGNTNVSLTNLTNSLGGDVTLNNTSNYFDGPSVAQGTVGTWFVSGTVTVEDTSSNTTYQFAAKLWDGTTVIASTYFEVSISADPIPISLSGVINNPAGNLRISVKDVTSTSGVIKSNVSGNSKDSTITAIRIG